MILVSTRLQQYTTSSSNNLPLLCSHSFSFFPSSSSSSPLSSKPKWRLEIFSPLRPSQVAERSPAFSRSAAARKPFVSPLLHPQSWYLNLMKSPCRVNFLIPLLKPPIFVMYSVNFMIRVWECCKLWVSMQCGIT